MQVVLCDDQSINAVADQIRELNFTVEDPPKLIQLNSQSDERQLHFSKSMAANDFKSVNELKKALDEIKVLPGIRSIQLKLQVRKCLATVSYHPSIIKGRTIYEEFLSREPLIQVEDPHLDNFRSKKLSQDLITRGDLYKALFVILFYAVYSMLVPQFEMFHAMILYPRQLHLFSFYTLFIIYFTFLTIRKFGWHIYLNAYHSYVQYRALNMDTLITLGSLSALAMAFFLLGLYTVQGLFDRSRATAGQDHIDMIRIHNIMTIDSMLETSALILAIITVGKYLENKAKLSILQMTEQMFPQDEFLQFTRVTYIEPKNKNLIIEAEKSYDICLIEQNDLILAEGPMRLLLDGTVLKIIDPVKIVDSVCYGQDDAFEGKVGDKLKSGAHIKYGKAIIQINNTIENSMLTQISKQLNMAQNACESTESGLSVIFQRLSQNFVKAVIFLSVLVLGVWAWLLAADMVAVDQFCRWCFPFEKAISILVISCPCALGLAIPSVLSITLNLAMRHGVLIKKNIVFDTINKVRAVLFDKTGTLFTRIESINEYQVSPDAPFNEVDLWAIVQLIENEQKHPIAQLLYQQAIKKTQGNILNSNLALPSAPRLLKNGLLAEIQNKAQNSTHSVIIGNKLHLAECQIPIQTIAQELIEQKEKQGRTVLILCIDKIICMTIFINNTNNLR